MNCLCGPQTYNITATGGVACDGTAAISTNFENAGGGVVAGGSASVNSSTLWDSFEAVYHLDESGSGVADEYKDSAHSFDGTGGVSPYTPTQVPGLWFNGNEFDGADYIVLTKDTMPDDGPITISLWVKRTNDFLERVFVSRGVRDRSANEGWNIAIGHNTANRPFVELQLDATSDWVVRRATGSTTLTQSCWYHVAAVWQPGTGVTLYVDGAQDGTASTPETDLAPSTKYNAIGRVDYYKHTQAVLQEIRFSPEARSSNWINTEYVNLCNNMTTAPPNEEGPTYG